MDVTQAPGRTLEQIALCVQALEDKKAEDVQILDVAGKSDVTDYLVIASGTSEPHLRALRRELERALSEHEIAVIGHDRSESSGWLVVDGFDFMVHLFTEEMREFYQLETLWRDAGKVELPLLMSA
jgi:ribosome-associated protein